MRRHWPWSRRPQSLPDIGPYWPALAGFDYRYDFPICESLVGVVEDMPEDLRQEFLAALEAASFAALVEVDLAQLKAVA